MKRHLQALALAVAAAGMAASVAPFHVEVWPTPKRRSRRPWNAADPLAAERAKHNEAVARRKADKRARKGRR